MTVIAVEDNAQTERSVSFPHRAIAVWLLTVGGMVFAMAVIGAVTRLTESGLSIVYWKPFTGVLPPLSEAEWEAVFAQYRTTPEYLKVNRGMTLAEFQTIFWWEYVHRVWGRLIGIVFALPFLWFLVRRSIPTALLPKVLGLFALGCVQGVVGWWMVKSGLVDHPDVSQYRLAVHLGLAVVIFGYALWLAMHLLARAYPWMRDAPLGPAAAAGLGRAALAVAGLVLLTILSGAFVAGLNAGLAYNTFPLMDGRLIPEGLGAIAPAWRNPFENVTTVQFDHRVLAVCTALAVWLLWWRCRRDPAAAPARRAADAAAAMAVLQFGLGVSTLLLMVPIALATAHQAGALVLLACVLWTAFELGRRRPATAPRDAGPESVAGSKA